MDIIKIKDLEVFGNHGVYKEENILGQKFLISADLYGDLSKAAKFDDIESSVNYGEVCQFIKKETQKNTFKLIESLTQHLATSILLKYTKIRKVQVEVKKPWAPVLMPLDTVSIVMERKWHKVYLSIGSNMGNKEKNLKEAIHLLDQDKYTKVNKVSTFIITSPVGDVVQDDFLNGALGIETLRNPKELLDLIKEIEAVLKRERTLRWGPRTIDLDILFFDDEIIEREDLIIPHIELENRMFVLEPMVEIAPYVKHPISGKSIDQLYKEKSN